jgi:hypothetical protein
MNANLYSLLAGTSSNVAEEPCLLIPMVRSFTTTISTPRPRGSRTR